MFEIHTEIVGNDEMNSEMIWLKCGNTEPAVRC